MKMLSQGWLPVMKCFFFVLQLNETLEGIDAGIGQLMKELKDRELQDCANIIIFSDHGEQ